MIRNGFFCIVCEYDVLFTFYLQMPLILVYIVRISKAKTLSVVEEINVYSFTSFRALTDPYWGLKPHSSLSFQKWKKFKKLIKKLRKTSKQEKRNGKREISLIIFLCIHVYIMCINIWWGFFSKILFNPHTALWGTSGSAPVMTTNCILFTADSIHEKPMYSWSLNKDTVRLNSIPP